MEKKSVFQKVAEPVTTENAVLLLIEQPGTKAFCSDNNSTQGRRTDFQSSQKPFAGRTVCTGEEGLATCW